MENMSVKKVGLLNNLMHMFQCSHFFVLMSD